MAGFEELGLRDALVERAREYGFDAPSAMQRSVIPVLRRGGNAIIRASSGSGITAAYAIALVERFEGESGTRALIIVPTNDRAERVANTVARFAHGSTARVSALTDTWSAAQDATIVVASAERLLGAIEQSQLKLDGVETVIVDHADAIARLNGIESLETLFTSLPREGQRVFIASELSDPVRKLAEAHARKALAFPARAAVPESDARVDAAFSVRYVVAAQEKKSDIVARLARASGGAVTLLSRSSSTAAAAERELRARGFDARGATYDGFDRSEVHGHLYAYDPPFSGEQLSECFGEGDIIICQRHELAHLRTVAQDANVKLTAAQMPKYEVDSLNAFRNEIRRAAREEDLQAQLLVLEPLFQELSAEEIAAAATALLRARRPAKAEATAAGKPGITTWARLFISIGERDGVRAGDIVGAITGESGVKGDDVGRVDIRDTFSVVEVASGAADRVIRALNGTTMKNRALRVDYDRKTASGSQRGARPGRPRAPRDGRAPNRRER